MSEPSTPYTTGPTEGRTAISPDRALIGYFLATFVLLVVLVRPFLTALLIAAVFTVWLHPLYVRLVRLWPRAYLVAGLVTFGAMVGIILPVSLLIAKAATQIVGVVGSLENSLASDDGLPMLWNLAEVIGDWVGMSADALIGEAQMRMRNAAGNVVQWLGSGAQTVVTALAAWSLNLLIFLFAVFTFLLNGNKILKRIKQISPLDDHLEDRLFRIFQGFSRGLALGGFVTALLQGVIAGIGYAIAGVEQSFFWGMMTGLFSFVPFVGTAVIWVPLSAMLYFQGSIGFAIFLAIYNMVVTGSVDNLVKPILIGQGSQLHPLLLFISIFGGLASMGFAGILVGPVAASFFLALSEVMTAPETIEQLPDPPPDR